MSRWKVPVILAAAIAAVVALVWAGASRHDIYMTPLATLDRARAERESVRVMGFVKEGTISLQKDALVTSFVMRDEGGTKALPVRFHGVTPGLFRDGSTVVASGRLGQDGVFTATDLMTKCPSKYEGMDNPHGDKAVHAPAAEQPGS